MTPESHYSLECLYFLLKKSLSRNQILSRTASQPAADELSDLNRCAVSKQSLRAPASHYPSHPWMDGQKEADNGQAPWIWL